MSTPAKFLFDTNLEAPAAPPPVAFSEVELLKSEHAAEIARVRAQTLELGKQQGRLEAEQAIERQLQEKIDQFIGDKEAYQAQINEQVQSARSSALLLAMTVAQKLAGSLLKKYPTQKIEEFFIQSLSLLPDQAALRFHLAPQLADALQPRLVQILEQNGHENELTLVEDDTLEGINCRLVWTQGGIEQNTDKTQALVEQMIETFVHSKTPSPQTNDAGQIESASQ